MLNSENVSGLSLLRLEMTIGPENCSELSEARKGGSAIIFTVTFFYYAKIVTSLFGFLVNLMSLIVFSNTRSRGTFIWLLILLSSVEVTYGASGVIFEVFIYLVQLRHHHFPSQTLAVACGYLIGYTSWTIYKAAFVARNWMVALIAFRRFRAITDPFGSRNYVSTRYVINSTIVINIMSVMIALPRVFEFSYRVCIPNFILVMRTTFVYQTLYARIYPLFYFLITCPLPIVIVIYCSLRMFFYLRRQASDIHRAQALSQQRQTTHTRTIFILCTVFFVCEMPMFAAGFLNIHQTLRPKSSEELSLLSIYLSGIANVLTNLDSILNFVVYMASLNHFKNDCKSYFMRCICRKNTSSSHFLDTSRRTSSINDTTEGAVLRMKLLKSNGSHIRVKSLKFTDNSRPKRNDVRSTQLE